MESIRTTMSGCTETGKPRIAILMAVYEPRMDWLREQLLSLDAQTYPNLMLYIRDDCSPTVPYEEIQSCVQDCIRSFPYEIRRNEKNLGSNGTFERLTQEAEGDYFAYCDQDDVWLPKKLRILEKTITESGARLVCSDMYIINENGDQMADSITKVRRHHVFLSGEGLAPKLLISNFVTGCTMLVSSKTAKESIPFCPYMVHDQYLALCAAEKGRIVSLPGQLIRYRIHESNQTLAMAGVSDKQDYFHIRIETLLKRLNWLEARFAHNEALEKEIAEALLWTTARMDNFRGNAQAKLTIWKNRRFSPLTSLFEILLAGAPNAIFMLFVSLKRKNIL